MFDFVRNHTRLALGFMLLLIIPSFIFFGIDGYTRFTDGGNTTVAKVDGVRHVLVLEPLKAQLPPPPAPEPRPCGNTSAPECRSPPGSRRRGRRCSRGGTRSSHRDS